MKTMSEQFEVITALCHGKDNEIVDELQDNVKQDLIYDPLGGVWLLGEWDGVDYE